MATEIEHKYLVTDDSYKSMATERHHIEQGYLNRVPSRTVRVRIIDDHAAITIKGANRGAARPEFEYPIPVSDARQLLEQCEPPVIVKTRHIVIYEGNRWEVDEFGGALRGLVLAELEIPTESYRYPLPPFVGANVTDNPKYYNSQLGTA
ncbi:MAG: CYTH domain-containing protein [Muribaculaceae bacterium]|nr:CYTH domain-containing protein [Muribaculaceae bacterium]